MMNLDLNLLVVFQALGETGHVTRAAARLGMTQPTFSHALRRLREALGDPLFVKTPAGMAMTPRARRLAPAVREVLEKVEGEVLARAPFAPRTLERTFRIRTTDMVEAMLLPELIRRLGREAPGVRVAVQSPGFQLPKEELENGACDLAIAGFFGELPGGFYRQPLYEDEYRCAVRPDHPRLSGRGRVSLEAFLAERHLLIAPSGELSGAVDRALGKKARFVVAGVSGFAVAPQICAVTDCVLTAPARLLALSLLHTFAPPLTLPRMRVVQVWHRRNHVDEAHRWFRRRVRGVLGGGG